MRIAPLLLATSIATLFLSHFAMSGSAQAAAMDPRDVTAMLARAQTIDSRCQVLSTAESQNLRDLVAKAEIALASKYSVAVARESLAKGRQAGKTAACDATAATDVRNILSAGVQATRQEPAPLKPEQVKPVQVKPEQMPAAPAPKPQVAAAPQATIAPEKTVVVQKPAAPPVKRTKPATKVSVANQTKTTIKLKAPKKVSQVGYADLAERYYVELKCRNMSLSRAQHMYENVLMQHKAALAKDGAAAVRRMLQKAQTRAGAQSCA